MNIRLQRTHRTENGEQVDDMDDVNTPRTSDDLDADDDTVRYSVDRLKNGDADADRADDLRVADLDEQWDDVFEKVDDDSVEVAPTGPSITTVEQHESLARNPAVEALWFRLSNPDFVTTALVPIPSVTSAEANETALELAKVGASITGRAVNVITAVGLRPGEAAETSRSIADGSAGQTIVVVESPSVDPSSIPILRKCPRVVLLVGLERSRSDALAGVTDLIGADRVVGSVCLEPAKPRRWWQLRRR